MASSESRASGWSSAREPRASGWSSAREPRASGWSSAREPRASGKSSSRERTSLRSEAEESERLRGLLRREPVRPGKGPSGDRGRGEREGLGGAWGRLENPKRSGDPRREEGGERDSLLAEEALPTEGGEGEIFGIPFLKD